MNDYYNDGETWREAAERIRAERPVHIRDGAQTMCRRVLTEKTRLRGSDGDATCPECLNPLLRSPLDPA